MTVQIEGPTKTFQAGAALAKFRLVRLSSDKLAYNGSSNADAVGILTREVLAADDMVAVRLWSAEGTHSMIASEAISAGVTVYAAADGKIASTGTIIVGISLDAAGADGDLFEVMMLSVAAIANVTRATLVQDDLAEYAIPFETLAKWDDFAAKLPGTAATDDLAIVEGTLATDAPQVEGIDAGGTTELGFMRFMFPVPPEYVDGETLNVQIRALMKVVSDGTATVDVQAYRQDAKTVDICSTAATSINSATAADKVFVLTPTNIVSGDLIDIRVALAVTDAGDAGPNITAVIERIKMLVDIKG